MIATTNNKLSIDPTVAPFLQIMANAGINRATDSFASLVGVALSVSEPEVKLVTLSQIGLLLGGPEVEAVGIYLESEGELDGQMMLVMPYSNALQIVDFMLGEPLGTTKKLGDLESSALRELGNVTGTSFLNAIALLVGLTAFPTPPILIVDMVGAILNIIISVVAQAGDEALMFSAKISTVAGDEIANFWMVPDPHIVEAFLQKVQSGG